jgi:hypothetical protein
MTITEWGKWDDFKPQLRPDSGPSYDARPLAGAGQWVEVLDPQNLPVGVLFTDGTNILGYWPEDADRHQGAPVWATQVQWKLKTAAAEGLTVERAWARCLAQLRHTEPQSGDLAWLADALTSRDTP